jgi:hypothetical protein
VTISDLLPDEQRNLYIDGTWREAASGKRFDVHDPADGSVITDVADGSDDDAMDALDAAVAAQADWAATAPRSCVGRSSSSPSAPTRSPGSSPSRWARPWPRPRAR